MHAHRNTPVEPLKTIAAAQTTRDQLSTRITVQQTELGRQHALVDSLAHLRTDLRLRASQQMETGRVEPTGGLADRCRLYPDYCGKLIVLDDRLIHGLMAERRLAIDLVTDLEKLTNLYEQELQARDELEAWYRRRENNRKWRTRAVAAAAIAITVVLLAET